MITEKRKKQKQQLTAFSNLINYRPAEEKQFFSFRKHK
jgi:hypothetical protein